MASSANLIETKLLLLFFSVGFHICGADVLLKFLMLSRETPHIAENNSKLLLTALMLQDLCIV